MIEKQIMYPMQNHQDVHEKSMQTKIILDQIIQNMLKKIIISPHVHKLDDAFINIYPQHSTHKRRIGQTNKT